MHLVKINKHEFTLPSQWPELKTKQFRKLAHLLFRESSPESRMKVLNRLIGRKTRGWIKRLSKEEVNSSYLEPSLEGESLLQIGELLEWLWLKPEPTADDEVEPILTQYQKWGHKKFLFPKKSLNDVTVYEWAYIEYGLQKLLEAPEDQAEGLAFLAAVMLRPRRPFREINAPGFDGYEREYFNPERIEAREKLFKNLPLYVAFAILDYVRQCQILLKARYHKIFEGPSSEGVNFGWEGSIMSVGETGTFGTRDETKRVNIHDFCFYLVKKKTEDEQQKKKLEELKRKNQP